jgi:hypothetical protein
MCSTILSNLHAKLQTNVTAELMVDSMALQPFSFEEWKSHRDESIAKVIILFDLHTTETSQNN